MQPTISHDRREAIAWFLAGSDGRVLRVGIGTGLILLGIASGLIPSLLLVPLGIAIVACACMNVCLLERQLQRTMEVSSSTEAALSDPPAQADGDELAAEPVPLEGSTMAIARFFATPIGRGIRILLGLALIVVGLLMSSPVGWIIAVVGLVPIAAGTANLCLLGPLFGAPLSGRAVQQRSGAPRV